MSTLMSPAAKPYSPPRHVDRARAADERLGRDAAVVHAGTAKQLALDEGGLESFAAQPRGQWRPGLPRSNHDGVVAFDHGNSPC